MDLYDRLNEEGAEPQPAGRPRKWIGSGEAHFISHLGITPDGITVEGAHLQIADQPIRVEQLADDLHIVHVGLLVEQINHDTRIHVGREHTYSLPRQTPETGVAPSWDAFQQILADTLDALRTIREDAQAQTARAKADLDAARDALQKLRTENT
jgi:hypothetical protein